MAIPEHPSTINHEIATPALTGKLIFALKPIVPLAVGIVILVVLWVSFSESIRNISFEAIAVSLFRTPPYYIAAAMGFTLLSFVCLSIYDFSALWHLRLRLPAADVFRTSFCAYAVGNFVGYGPLSGGAIRYHYYRRLGLKPADIGKIITYITLAFGLGLAGVMAVGLVSDPADITGSIGASPRALTMIGSALLIGLVAVFMLSVSGRSLTLWRSRSIALPQPKIMIVQFVGTVADVASAAATLWVLMPHTDIGFPAFMAVFAVAIALGVASHVPAGLGAFEAVIIAVLGRTSPMSEVISALLLYRLIYYGLPLFLAAGLMGAAEFRRSKMAKQASWLAKIGVRLSPNVLSVLTFAMGVALILSGVTPASIARLDLLAEYLPLSIVESAHFLESVLGLGLIVIARGLAHRLDGAWWAAAISVGAAIVLSLLKAIALSESAILLLLLGALIASRRQFSRPASLMHQPLSASWLVAIATVLMSAAVVLFLVYSDVDYQNGLWWDFEFTDEAPRSLRALLGLIIGAGTLAGWSLLRPAKGKAPYPTKAEIDEATAIVASQSYPDANLVRMGDKMVLFSDDRRAFIMFSRRGLSWVALFDPIGPQDASASLIWQFVEMAQRAGGRAVFYQVQPQNLCLYADAGLRAYKIGESAHVDLQTFDLEGAKRASLRHAINRAQREGLSFFLLEPGEAVEEIGSLRDISDRWLAAQKSREKRFSLGAFDADYVCAQPVAIVKRNNKIIAFATILRTSLKNQVTLDLMRSMPDTPPGTMEYLIVCLMLRLKSRGYLSFDIGMTPLSGLSNSPAAPFWHRVARVVYEHGERFYHFTGLRAFKAKFQPQWQSRYLAVSNGTNPALALADITALISGGFKGMVRK
ncbi:bifunctional lysylphosphatidylglycerol flippase/synthetase MprF [Rhizobium sp. ICMP 5592]|uniref:bifunctional lysylphosphatidylglycerol flippase/synthetase MprF n=1 Tax=Rhizobium sp. ICMP 5592 TaxID=2292445 RepID=UPI001295EB76|nr:bifunctional lysylphosphatidylglycerol flippase/synthetase MprF [Rhizobium sp. ICMP 5592]